MKKFLTLGLLFAGAAALPHLAAAQPAAPQIACMEAASEETLMTGSDIEALCLGSQAGSGPVTCYEAGTDETTLSNLQLIQLCRCARGDGPVRCFESATEETDLYDGRAIELCRPIETRRLRPDCTPIEAP